MGFFCDEARSKGYTPHASELNRTQEEPKRSPGIPVDCRPLGEAYPGMEFGIIYHCDVLSHFTYPIAEFGDVQRRYHPLIHSFQYPDHLFFFSQSSLRLLRDRSGFNVLKVTEMMTQRHLGKGHPGRAALPSSASPPRVGNLKKLVRHGLEYGRGALYPFQAAPQTLIVIAASNYYSANKRKQATYKATAVC